MDYNISTTQLVIIMVIAIWELIWKGFALWRASQNNQSGWFIAIMVVNSAGILPIIYLLTNPGVKSSNK